MSEHTGDLKSQTRDILLRLGVEETHFADGDLTVQSPIDGSEIAHVKTSTIADMDAACDAARDAFLAWRQVPPPHRGELVRLFGEELRAAKEDLGKLVSLEVGKILSEGQGEVQEMIDITDYAVGISRQLYGRTIASERPGHRMMETWHPAGPCGIISAFNFPVAVWSWNATLALVCGDPLVWKPSEKAPLTALASMAILKRALGRFGDAPENLAQCLIGGADIGEALVDHRHMAIISATGSTAMGRAVGPRVAARFGKSILELGGNNAMIVAPSADLELAVRAIAFSAVGTAGQRCTTLRRVIVHESLAEVLVDRLQRAYATLPIGTPLEPDTLVGPLIDEKAGTAMDRALEVARSQGGRVYGGEIVAGPGNGCYRSPALVVMPGQTDIVAEETFAPILYVMSYTDLQEAMDLHNDVPQGLASCIFTTDIREAETFLSDIGSDCGIANVNIGPSGAEIGGAFGGEKETGGGRESGSDAWKGYMRRATNTINYSRELPLAQGVKFDID